ncbi:RNA polymerase sigma-70 factor (ECF subfamily) [Algoriphagus sp. 4150]|uniref:RNA polymerase sigma-70 factor n=1 Tax=Algoriphagus sp. 4150 TaxID=2817756 RepID=UPI0028639EF9|nr:RNA polymerase sigma-70 factor [Algoriphagus sp. 4150]MDR7130928.1 RNA polymerase sigma-70 factor (ECF subfamily) [Algoriphagus sp. 4150]
MEELTSIKSKEDFERLYHLYATKMLSLAYTLVNERETAQEIVQEVFKSIWERKDKLKFTGSVSHYLIRAVKLESIDYYRKKARVEKHMHCALENYCNSNRDTEEQIAFNELTSRLDYLVDRLPCQCREVYKLSREKGLSAKAIASTLLISEKTVESHLTKALKFIKKEISADNLS